jgi:hypothetical protein
LPLFRPKSGSDFSSLQIRHCFPDADDPVLIAVLIYDLPLVGVVLSHDENP